MTFSMHRCVRCDAIHQLFAPCGELLRSSSLRIAVERMHSRYSDSTIEDSAREPGLRRRLRRSSSTTKMPMARSSVVELVGVSGMLACSRAV